MMGAICYYLSDGRGCSPAALSPEQEAIYHDHLGKFLTATGRHVLEWNDKDGWTFEQFAKKAEELGL